MTPIGGISSTVQERPFYRPLIQDNPVEPVLSPGTDLLEQPLELELVEFNVPLDT